LRPAFCAGNEARNQPLHADTKEQVNRVGLKIATWRLPHEKPNTQCFNRFPGFGKVRNGHFSAWLLSRCYGVSHGRKFNPKTQVPNTGTWGTRQSIGEALTIVDKFEDLFAAWQTLGTAWQLYEHAKETKKAKMYRDRAASCILRIANTFAPEEPLLATFLAAAPIRRILSEKTGGKAPQQPKAKHEAAS